MGIKKYVISVQVSHIFLILDNRLFTERVSYRFMKKSLRDILPIFHRALQALR